MISLDLSLDSPGLGPQTLPPLATRPAAYRERIYHG
jgi:hypothetical protein